jgi:lactoylglutathione lyase
MKLGFTTIEVNNLDESIDFYTKILSLKEIRRFSPNPSIQMVFLSGDGGGIIQLVKTKNLGDNTINGGYALKAIGIEVDHLKELSFTLKEKKVKFLGELMENPGNVNILFIEDPNGVRVELIEGFKI